ncbi:hypothetical protein [Pseudomonas sp. 273]|uniref:hypothetical protein n=1 Tax=Pseudomonas sp. 273 TaxID=75692 RepID=UPI0023D7FC94|nr:hypothetical protein [Pseudomonas sp. 273]
MKTLILIVLLSVLVGCTYEKEPREVANGAAHIRVWHDDKRGVTCWLYGGTSGGISCLPDGALH